MPAKGESERHTASALERFRTVCRAETHARPLFTLDIGALPGFTATVQRRFELQTGMADPAEYFDYDLRRVLLPLHYGGEDPRLHHRSFPEATVFDEWGIGHWAGGAADTYEKIFHPLAGASDLGALAGYPEPSISVADAETQVQNYHAQGYPVTSYAGSIYEWAWWLRGMESLMMDFLDQPDFARAIIRKTAGFSTKLSLTLAGLNVDVLAYYDDAGMQTGMQISPDLWREFIKPAWSTLLAAVRRVNPDVKFFLHSCGDISEIVPDVVEVGFDILHPLQPECMDAASVKRDYGDGLIVCGTLGAQSVLPFGTPDGIKATVERLVDELAYDGRCILCPSNVIQPETPWENIVAFAEAAGHKGARRWQER